MRNLKGLALLAGAYGALSGYPASTLAYEQASTPKTDLSRADISRCVARSLGLMQRSRIPPPLTSFSFKGFFGMDPVDSGRLSYALAPISGKCSRVIIRRNFSLSLSKYEGDGPEDPWQEAAGKVLLFNDKKVFTPSQASAREGFRGRVNFYRTLASSDRVVRSEANLTTVYRGLDGKVRSRRQCSVMDFQNRGYGTFVYTEYAPGCGALKNDPSNPQTPVPNPSIKPDYDYPV